MFFFFTSGNTTQCNKITIFLDINFYFLLTAYYNNIKAEMQLWIFKRFNSIPSSFRQEILIKCNAKAIWHKINMIQIMSEITSLLYTNFDALILTITLIARWLIALVLRFRCIVLKLIMRILMPQLLKASENRENTYAFVPGMSY